MTTEQVLQDALAARRATDESFTAWIEARWIALDLSSQSTSPKTPWSHEQALKAYSDWLSNNYHGDMEYLARHLALKLDPQLYLPKAQSLIVVTKSYVPSERPHNKLKGLRLAAYAQGEDYHDVFGGELAALAKDLGERFPGENFRAGTDSWPLLERDYARAAGLGWIGKNSCLISPKVGSFFFIGGILSTIPVKHEIAPLPDFCGTCTRCMDICPTQAFAAPRVLDATRCISYWTIESKKIAAPELSNQFGDWFFGCDLCQSVCPWNQKPFRHQSVLQTDLVRPQTEPETTEPTIHDLHWILTASDAEIKTQLKDSALSRAKVFGLRRNALYVTKNVRYQQLRSTVEAWTEDPELGELARQTLNNLN